MGVTAIQRPLPDAGGYGDLMHADGVDAMLGKELLRDLQDALAMLHRVSPFESRMLHAMRRQARRRQARRPRKMMTFFMMIFFHHNSSS